jgi:hypothetical protein
VISNINTVSSTPLLPRNFNGSIFTQEASATGSGGRIWFATAGNLFFVNSSGSADYSEYFATADPSLGVGEVVALDPAHANAVRRARPRDRSSTVGIVSLAGTHNNDNESGNRQDDPGFINVGLAGQVPVLVTTENGSIQPGDALTVSGRYRGRAVKAVGPGRIIGFALTHFPPLDGERDYEPDINGGASQRLMADHVMCYLSVGWYEPAGDAGDGEEPPAVESQHAMSARLNAVAKGNAPIQKREAARLDPRRVAPVSVAQ